MLLLLYCTLGVVMERIIASFCAELHQRVGLRARAGD